MASHLFAKDSISTSTIMSEIQYPVADQRFMRDILDLIFDEAELGDFHKRTLFACSRVSKDWRRAALKRIFRSISLIVRRPHDPPPSVQINRYINDFVDAPEAPHLAPLVRKLTLKWGSSQWNSVQYDFIDYLPSFPALHTLSLVGQLAERLPDSMSSRVGTLTLDSLHIGDCQSRTTVTHNVVAFCDLLSLFGKLRCLQLDTIQDFVHLQNPAVWQDIPLPRVSSLKLRNTVGQSQAPGIVSTILQPRSVLLGLQSLDIIATEIPSKDFISLSEYAPTIEHLALEVEMPSTDASHPRCGV